MQEAFNKIDEKLRAIDNKQKIFASTVFGAVSGVAGALMGSMSVAILTGAAYGLLAMRATNTNKEFFANYVGGYMSAVFAGTALTYALTTGSPEENTGPLPEEKAVKEQSMSAVPLLYEASPFLATFDLHR